MQSRAKAGKRYARALFELAGETGQIDRVRADLEAIQQALASIPELAAFIRNYTIPAAVRSRTLSELFAKKIAPLTFTFIRLIEEKKRGGILDQICTAFTDLHDHSLGIVKGQITTPFQLEQADTQLVTSFAQSKTRGRLKLSAGTDQSLLGGFKLRLGDIVYDASTAAQLHTLKEKMINV